MLGNLNGWHLVILLAVILLLFGAAKLPALAKSMGQSARVFKGEMNAMKEEDAANKAKGGTADTATDAASSTDAPSTSTSTADPKP